MIQEGDELQINFIEDFNLVVARELRSIKQQGMKVALHQSLVTCDKLNLILGQEFGERPPRNFDEIYGLLTNEQCKSLFNKNCAEYFVTVYQVVHSVFKEDVF